MCRHAEQLVPRFHQLLVTQTASILQVEVETGGGAEFGDRGQVEGEDLGFLDAEQEAHGAADDGVGAAVRCIPLIPVLELDEGHAAVLTTTGEAEVGDRQYRFDILLLILQEVVAHLAEYLLGTLLGGADRQLHHRHDDALILFRQEGGRQAHEQHRQHRQHGDVDDAETHTLLDHLADPALVAVGAAVEQAVEPAEEAALLTKLAVLDRLENGGAQGRGQDQRHQHREHHGRDDGQRELTVDGTGGATEEGHRHEHRREHQGNPDQGAGDLIH